MNKTLLKQMVREVSVPTLAGLLVDYAETMTEEDADISETLNAIETIVAELRSRTAPKPERRSRKKAEEPQPETPRTFIGNGGAGE
ncbi:hypothetical protein [Paenibacillus xanthanilyticus]|uniref:Uncharacterized protein n=1 Tax=Paenibacillus xanthanilyticus TaxID=1783531 RepID=A0ABV8KC15_9BACL